MVLRKLVLAMGFTTTTLAGSQEVCNSIACPGTTCSTVKTVTAGTVNGMNISGIVWFTNMFGGMATNATCQPVPAVNGSNMGVFTFAAMATGLQPNCLWAARIRTSVSVMYYDGPTCQINASQDGLPVELLEFEIQE